MADYTYGITCQVCGRDTLHRYPDDDTPNDALECTEHEPEDSE